MNKWKEGDNKYRVFHIGIDRGEYLQHGLIVVIQRLWQPNMAGYIQHEYHKVTPSSLARVMRVIQGKPVFDTCGWRGVLYGAPNLQDTSCGKVVDTSINFGMEYCPYCGRRIVVQE